MQSDPAGWRRILPDYFIRWARDLDDAHMRLVAVPSEVGFALDPYDARIDPYHVRIAPGDAIELRVLVTNHGDQADSTRVHLELPPEWAAEPRVTTREIASRETLAFPFRVTTSAATRGRVVRCADVTLGSRRLGQYAEAIVDLQD